MSESSSFLESIGSFFTSLVQAGNTVVWSTPAILPWLVVILLGTGFYVTVRLNFIQLRHLGHAINVVRGKYDDPEHAGDINHFQALSTALSATVGIGNIAGVAMAIHLGGPGALLWMWVTAVFGMAVKYAECTLSMQYREFDSEGNAAGGPMYYIEKGLEGPLKGVAKPLAVTFAVCGVVASFGGGNMNQANTTAVSAQTDFGVSAWVTGAIVATLVGAVILGGIRRIGQFTSRLAPGMALFYVAGALLVILFNISEVPQAFATIIADAFNPKASVGGSVAGVFMTTLVWGIRRGLFSNEAGQGSAPIAHAAAKTDQPVREGVVAMLGPMIDTLIICTMTGLVIILTGVWDEKHPGEYPMSAVTVVPNVAVEPGETEHSRKTRSRAAREEMTTTSADIEVPVVGGRQRIVAFIKDNGFVDEPTLLDAGGAPFTGTLRYAAAEATLKDAEGNDVVLRLSGKSLLLSSALTAMAFKKGLSPIGDWGNYLVTLAVFLFALSTMISWSYYGDRCIHYLVGTRAVFPYRVAFTFFVFLGAIRGVEWVWQFGDLALGLMTLPNLIGLLLLTPKVVGATREYFRSGEDRHVYSGLRQP